MGRNGGFINASLFRDILGRYSALVYPCILQLCFLSPEGFLSGDRLLLALAKGWRWEAWTRLLEPIAWHGMDYSCAFELLSTLLWTASVSSDIGSRLGLPYLGVRHGLGCFTPCVCCTDMLGRYFR
jgi:hypothetical protein